MSSNVYNAPSATSSTFNTYADIGSISYNYQGALPEVTGQVHYYVYIPSLSGDATKNGSQDAPTVGLFGRNIPTASTRIGQRVASVNVINGYASPVNISKTVLQRICTNNGVARTTPLEIRAYYYGTRYYYLGEGLVSPSDSNAIATAAVRFYFRATGFDAV